MTLPRVIGVLLPVLLIVVAIVGALLFTHPMVLGLLSGERLQRTIATLLEEVATGTHRLLVSSRFVDLLVFLVGAGAGWASALFWVRGRVRHRPLIIADLRRADMSFAAGLRHVRVNALPPVASDDEAMWLLMGEAGRGRLTLWRPTAADTLQRIPRRSVRVAVLHASNVASAGRWKPGFCRTLMLLEAEVEHIWPSRRRTLIDSPRA